MNINTAFNSSLFGLQQARAGIVQNAQDIASLGAVDRPSNVNLTESLIDLKINERSFQANAKVLGVVDDTIGTLLNVFA